LEIKGNETIIKNIDILPKMPQPKKLNNIKIYKQKDFTEESVKKLYDNFKNGLVEKYLSEINIRWQKSPIVKNHVVISLLQ